MRGPILAGRSILIVEDEPLIALDMEIALRRVGAKVLSTAYLWVGLHLQSIRAFRRPCSISASASMTAQLSVGG